MTGEVRVERVPAGHVELAVHHLGPADRPLWLLAHGVGSSARFLLDTFGPPVVGAGGRLAAVDLRGHGASTPLSEPADHAFDRHVDDLVVLARRLRPEVLGGVSLGGHAAVGAVASGAPGVDPAVVLACLPAWSGRAVPGEGPHAAVASQVRASGVAAMVDRFRADTDMVSWLRDVLVRDWPVHDAGSLAAALVALDGGQAPTLAEVGALTAPLALVGWPDDPGHPLEVARDWAAAAPVAVLEETSLEAMQRDPTALGRAAVRAVAAAVDVDCAVHHEQGWERHTRRWRGA